jgi:cytochrome c oxidase assembly protein subunit 15
MNEQWIPSGAFAMEPWALNFFENPTLIQFIHRYLAKFIVLFIGGGFLYFWSLDLTNNLRNIFKILVSVVVVQFILGVMTLLLKVPVWLGAFHQGVAMVLVLAAISLVYFTSGRQTA